ncbi:hypothetical protein LZ32DRAFT_391772 [Colletotrichum eremochloae]|nr:hypothetical protein LZ32DRAFT_391772 [Colletotrichum eremochloae]
MSFHTEFTLASLIDGIRADTGATYGKAIEQLEEDLRALSKRAKDTGLFFMSTSRRPLYPNTMSSSTEFSVASIIYGIHTTTGAAFEEVIQKLGEELSVLSKRSDETGCLFIPVPPDAGNAAAARDPMAHRTCWSVLDAYLRTLLQLPTSIWSEAVLFIAIVLLTAALVPIVLLLVIFMLFTAVAVLETMIEVPVVAVIIVTIIYFFMGRK